MIHHLFTKLLIILIIIKILWFITLGIHFFLFIRNLENKTNDKIEEYLHLINYTFSAIILIYLFNHLTPTKVTIEGELKMYLYFFGILLLLGNFYKLLINFIKDVYKKDIKM